MQKTKILVISDVHGDSKLIQRLAQKSKNEKIDLVILAGDITFMESENSMKNLIGPFLNEKQKPSQILLLHGNHESPTTIDFLAELYPNTKNLHGYSIKHKDVGIFGVGGADFGREPMSEKDFEKYLEQAHYYIKDMQKKILVTHMHPEGSKSEFSGFEGSSSLRKAIEKFQPDFFIHGHIHEASGVEEKIGKTTVINVSRRERIIEL